MIAHLAIAGVIAGVGVPLALGLEALGVLPRPPRRMDW